MVFQEKDNLISEALNDDVDFKFNIRVDVSNYLFLVDIRITFAYFVIFMKSINDS